MVEIIDFKTRETLDEQLNLTLNSTLSDKLLEILKAFPELEGFLVCLKDTKGDIILFRNDELDIKDRSYILQLLQSDIQDEFAPTDNLEEEDL